ncbi:MAG: hypothetical protein NW224_29960 [Leptolyngbyaceae cyanobacterium bins.302]|nr:hypothetical protein [Leptolyngbyaceae cyanobacterium bins.302]
MSIFKKRLGPDPHADGRNTSNANGCPDVWELEDGTFAVIGLEKTKDLVGLLPETASCGPDESIIVIPRDLLIGIKHDIPFE